MIPSLFAAWLATHTLALGLTVAEPTADCVSPQRVVEALTRLTPDSNSLAATAASVTVTRARDGQWELDAMAPNGSPVHARFLGTCSQVEHAMATHLAIVINSMPRAAPRPARSSSRVARSPATPTTREHEASSPPIDPTPAEVEEVEPAWVVETADDDTSDQERNDKEANNEERTSAGSSLQRPAAAPPRPRRWYPVIRLATGYGTIPGHWRQPNSHAIELWPGLDWVHRSHASVGVTLRGAISTGAPTEGRSVFVELIGCQQLVRRAWSWGVCTAVAWGKVRMPYPHDAGIDATDNSVWLINPSLLGGYRVSRHTRLFVQAGLTVNSSRRLAATSPIGTSAVFGVRRSLGCTASRPCPSS